MIRVILVLLIEKFFLSNVALCFTGIKTSSLFRHRLAEAPVNTPHIRIKSTIPDGIRSHLLENTKLFSGYGIASHYSWTEEAYEIDVTVPVPKGTLAKDIVFRATSTSIDLQLINKNNTKTVLLDKNRPLRGKVNVDGTYWVISDGEERITRQVTVTIEKLLKTPADDFTIMEYDWKGVYANDSEEVQEIKYDEPETLNVREYAAQLGVDIDNIDMSKVDPNMFSSGLNLTQKSLEQLTEAGYVQEITKQQDGEFVENEENNQREPSKIPFLDTDSPWQQGVPVTKVGNETVIQQERKFTRAAFASDSAKSETGKPIEFNESMNKEELKDLLRSVGLKVSGTKEELLSRLKEHQRTRENREVDSSPSSSSMMDPIDALPTDRLREILKSQGISTEGSHEELKTRLRKQVNTLLQGNQE